MQDNQEKTTAATFPLAAYKIKDVLWTLAFTLAAVILPALLAHAPANQWITGTIVNAVLFIAAWRVGAINAALVAFLPSSIALMRGLLPAPMAALIPYIIISNLILIVIFHAQKKRPLLGVITASAAKFLFLAGVTTFFVNLSSPFVYMMHWPQLFTALAGGLIAFAIIKTRG